MAVQDELVYTDAEVAAELGGDSDVAEVVDQDDEANPDMESDEDVETTWDDDQQTGDDDAETEGKARTGAPKTREFKANGKAVKVDMADQPRVDQLITLGLGARAVFTERDSLKKASVVKDKAIAELSDYKKLWNQLEDSKSDHDALYEKIFGKKFADSAGAYAKRESDYASASPEERKLIDLERRLEAAQKSQSQREVAAKKAAEDADTKNRNADLREYKSRLSSEFYKYEFSTKVPDPVHAEKLNKILWRNVVADLKSEFGAADEIPADAIRRAFKENASVLSSTVKQTAAREVKKITADKKKTAQSQASTAASRNFNKNPDPQKLSRETDPVKLWKKMFG